MSKRVWRHSFVMFLTGGSLIYVVVRRRLNKLFNMYRLPCWEILAQIMSNIVVSKVACIIPKPFMP